ncbi:MAG TPA: hypothetical protein VIJ51_01235 [Solirubrobacteraceae bacterium]
MMLKRYLCGLPLTAAVLALAVGPVGQASAQTVVSPYTGQTVAQPNGGGQTVTNPTGQGVTQAGDGQTLTQPSAAQYINQPAEGTQTLTQPGQCIQQSAAGQDVTQAGQDVPQGVPAGSCGASTAGSTPTTPAATTPAGVTPTTPTTTSPSGPEGPAGPAGPSGPAGHNGTSAQPVLVTTTAKKLAFTGFDVWKLLLIGGLFVGAGAGTWRMARKVGSTTTLR